MNKKIIYLIVGLIIVIIALFAFNKFLKEEVVEEPIVEEPPVEEPTEEPIEIISVNNLVVPNQAPGTEIFVEKILLKTDGKGGFVTIHRVNEEGETEEIMGVSSYFEPGVTENILVVLNEGETVDAPLEMVAMLHADDGDGVWNSETDIPLLDDEGNIVQVVFTMDNPKDAPGYDTKL